MQDKKMYLKVNYSQLGKGKKDIYLELDASEKTDAEFAEFQQTDYVKTTLAKHLNVPPIIITECTKEEFARQELLDAQAKKFQARK